MSILRVWLACLVLAYIALLVSNYLTPSELDTLKQQIERKVENASNICHAPEDL